MDWKLFASSFALIFVAELPDKTAFASLLLATQNHPLAVFFGAAGAFVIQSLVAVTFGSAIGLLPGRWVHTGAGVLFVVFAILMWIRKADGQNLKDHRPAQTHSSKLRFRRSMTSSFLVIFVAEWGDLTQLATATLQAKYRDPVTLFTAATLSLWSVTALGVTIGHYAKHVVHPKSLQKIAAVAFATVGSYFLLYP